MIAEILLPIDSMPQELRDGRTVCIYRNGIRFYCKWKQKTKSWHLGITPIIGATHYCLPENEGETLGSGI